MFDQNFLFMAFLMLCFAGLATMFYFMMRNIDELTRTLKEDRNQMQTNLRALESSLNHLADLLSRMTAAENLPRGAASVRPETLRAHVAPGTAGLSGASSMSGASSLSGASGLVGRNPESGPPDPLELRSAMVSPLRMADGEAAPSAEPAKRRPAPASEPSGVYGGLSFDASGSFGMNMDPQPASASPMTAFTPGSAASPAGSVGSTPAAASIAPDMDGPISLSGASGAASVSGLSDASGQGTLPNLSLDGISPVRRR